MFCDKVEIYVKAGNGGDGHLSFLHEKYREFGGPDGGDGGSGANVVFRVDPSWNTLYYYKTNRRLMAENGEEGKMRHKRGKAGEHLIVNVPVGTMIYNAKTNELLADLSEYSSELVIAKGGEGGFGNAHFTSSTRQAPRFAELGIAGEELYLRLELKLIADVGLVGLPNIGKSTFLSVISAARPKIADYPFTTIVPNLGVVEGYNTKGFVVADIPGLIEGASLGKGLGDEFLRHIERTRVIIHFLDSMSEDIEKDFRAINNELKTFNKNILKKPQILVVSRIDLLNESERNSFKEKAEKTITENKTLFKYCKIPFLFSAVTHEGVKELVLEVDKVLSKIPKQGAEHTPVKVFTIADVDQDGYTFAKEDGGFIIGGKKIERFALKTDFNNPFAVMRFYDILQKMGVLKDIEKQGGRFGDKIKILDKTIEYKG